MRQSDELDVFEAAGYYSNSTDMLQSFQQQPIMAEERGRQAKKPKLPLSPAGRLASFFISFFHHGSPRKERPGIMEGRPTRERKRRVSESSLITYASPCPSSCKAHVPPSNVFSGRSGYCHSSRDYGRRAFFKGTIRPDQRIKCESLFIFKDKGSADHEGDSGWESDSSSDLFDLPNCSFDRVRGVSF